MTDKDAIFTSIQELVMCHSPSGVESEVDELLRRHFERLGLSFQQDAAGNLIAIIPGSGGGSLAITAHKDEIGAIVTDVQDGGRVKVRRLGGAYPWVYGEGVVDLLGDAVTISGVLSFGSRHTSHASPQHAHKDDAPLKWSNAWVETKLAVEALAEAGVHAGTRVVVGKHRKAPFKLGDHIASYTLDNKASLAILLALAARLRKPIPDIYLVASAKEEVGAVGALYFSQHQGLDAVIALEVAPISAEYPIKDGPAPVLLAEDSFGIYDESLNSVIRRIAAELNMPLQLAAISGFGSDASISMKHGHVARAACLGFPTQNTHGYEIAHLEALTNCIALLEGVCNRGIGPT